MGEIRKTIVVAALAAALLQLAARASPGAAEPATCAAPVPPAGHA